MSEVAFNIPVNSVSFGQVSYGILNALYKKDPTKNYPIFPIGGQVDLAAYKVEQGFVDWLQKNINSAQSVHSRKTPIVKLWHLMGSLESFSEKQNLITFFELDNLIHNEINVIKNQNKVFVTSNYTKQIFEDFGAKNVVYCPLGFDSTHFFDTKKKYFSDGRISFLLPAKLEHRKRTLKTLATWAKKYGNSHKYHLNAAISNVFMKSEDQNALINQALQGKKYWNINLLPFLPQNLQVNDLLNSCDIVLGMSGGEGFGLMEMHSLALGKHGVILNAHAYKDYATEENSVLVSPNGKIPVYDNIFFRQGTGWNQGQIYDWDEEDFLEGCEAAIKRVEKDRVNTEGLKLQEKFSYHKTVDVILENI
ncbi:MAG: hypothetical protein WC390_06545 [Sulfurimonas sp.]|jgi:hypothetical protein